MRTRGLRACIEYAATVRTRAHNKLLLKYQMKIITFSLVSNTQTRTHTNATHAHTRVRLGRTGEPAHVPLSIDVGRSQSYLTISRCSCCHTMSTTRPLLVAAYKLRDCTQSTHTHTPRRRRVIFTRISLNDGRQRGGGVIKNQWGNVPNEHKISK